MGIRNTLTQEPGRTDRHRRFAPSQWQEFSHGVRRKAVFGASGRPTPTERLSIEFRRGRRLDAPPLPTRTITAGWGHPAPAHARGEAPLGGRCKKRERRGRSLFSLLFSPGQHSLAPAGMESSSSSRCSFSSPFSLCTAEMSIPQEGMPIIFRAGRFKMATAVLPTRSSGS